MPLINCKVELSLKWIENGAHTTSANADKTTFKITDAKLYFPVVTLSTEHNAELTKQLNEGFKRPFYWNNYKVIPNKPYNQNHYIRELLDSSYQGVKGLFVLAYNNTEGNDQVSIDSFKKYFLPRVKIENYNIEIDGRNFYDQSINGSIKQYDKVRKVSAGQRDDYTTSCSLDFAYFEKSYRLIAADLSKKKALDANPRAIQQIFLLVRIVKM